MSATNGPPVLDEQTSHAIYHSIHHTHKALREIRDLLESQLMELSVGGAINDRDLENWPVPGLTRKVLSNRRASGTDSLVVPAATATLVVEALPGRLGGTICNAGTNPATLYLAGVGHVSQVSAGTAALFLAAGASWDFRLGTILWAGTVTAISALGTTLTVAQV